MGAAAATAGNAAGVGRSGAGDMQRGGGGGEESRYQEDGPQHRRAEEGSEALTGSSKVAEAWLRWSRIVDFGRKNGQAPILGRNRIVFCRESPKTATLLFFIPNSVLHKSTSTTLLPNFNLSSRFRYVAAIQK